MKSWIIALRIARREARRAKGRTALIVVMIAVPVMALTFAATMFDMNRLTPQEKVTRLIGHADAVLSWNPDGTPVTETPLDAGQSFLIGGDSAGKHTAADLLPLLPAGSGVTEYWSGAVSMYTAGGVGDMNAFGLDLDDPIAAGIVKVVGGRAARADNEVDASAGALARIGAKVGDTVRVAAGKQSYIVVGVVEVSGQLDESIVFRPSQRPTDISGNTMRDLWLVATPTPVTWDQVTALNAKGVTAQTRPLMLNPPPDPNPGGTSVSEFSLATIVAGLGLLEVVLLAGPAFAVGARRRQRDLALVATSGGTPAVLRRIVLADGIVCGMVAAAIGVVIGVIVAFSTRSLVEEHVTNSRFGSDRVSIVMLLGIVVVAIATGVAGALVPAFSAGRQDIVVALSGRRGATRSRLVWLLLGIALVALGAAIATYGSLRYAPNTVVVGLAVGEFGMVLCTPTLVGLVARLGRFLPLAPRIALRDTARRRAASAPAISAVMAAVAGSVALTVYMSARDAEHGTYEQALPMGSISIIGTSVQNGTSPPAGQSVPVGKISAAVHAVLPGATAVPFDIYRCNTDNCQLAVEIPVERRCPYQAYAVLNKADQRLARADPRCSDGLGTSFSIYGVPAVVTDDSAVVASQTGLAGADLDAAIAVLRRGGALVTDPREVENGLVTLAVQSYDDGPAPTDVRSVTVPGYAVTTGIHFDAIIAPSVVTRLKLGRQAAGVTVTPVATPTQADADALTAALAETAPQTQTYIERGEPSDSDPLPLILAIAAGVIALGAASIATGLAAADGRGDLTTLAAVGATPRVRRVLSLAQSGVIAGLGSLLGAVVGYGAAAAVLTGLNSTSADSWPGPAPYPISIPWLNLGVSLVAVPVIAMLGAGLLTRSRLPSERRAD